MKLRQIFSQQTHPTHSIGPKIHILGHFGPFRYGMKDGGEQAKLVALMHKFSK
jgi:hypothetical protein